MDQKNFDLIQEEKNCGNACLNEQEELGELMNKPEGKNKKETKWSAFKKTIYDGEKGTFLTKNKVTWLSIAMGSFVVLVVIAVIFYVHVESTRVKRQKDEMRKKQIQIDAETQAVKNRKLLNFQDEELVNAVSSSNKYNITDDRSHIQKVFKQKMDSSDDEAYANSSEPKTIFPHFFFRVIFMGINKFPNIIDISDKTTMFTDATKSKIIQTLGRKQIEAIEMAGREKVNDRIQHEEDKFNNEAGNVRSEYNGEEAGVAREVKPKLLTLADIDNELRVKYDRPTHHNNSIPVNLIRKKRI